MARVLTPLPCDTELLSAYHDEALDYVARRMVELHLRNCTACRLELRRHDRLATALRIVPVTQPPERLATDVGRRIARLSTRKRHTISTQMLIGSSLAAVLFLALLFERVPTRTTDIVEAYPPPGTSGVSTDTAITISFPGPVDKARIQESLRFDPPIQFDLIWESPERVAVIPLVPLAASATYTLVDSQPVDTSTSNPGPETLTVFRTAPESAANGGPTPTVSRTAFLNNTAPAPASDAQLAVPITPTPTGLAPNNLSTASSLASWPSPKVTTGAKPAASPAAPPAHAPPVSPTANAGTSTSASAPLERFGCPTIVRQPFATIFNSRPDVRAALGCPRTSTTPITVDSQVFQGGILLVLEPDNFLYQLDADGTWLDSPASDGDGTTQSTSSSSIGASFTDYWGDHPEAKARVGMPIAPEQVAAGTVMTFRRGFMVAVADWLYVLDDAGLWQRLTILGPVGTPMPENGAVQNTVVVGGVTAFGPLHIRATPSSAASATPPLSSPLPATPTALAPAPTGTPHAAPTSVQATPGDPSARHPVSTAVLSAPSPEGTPVATKATKTAKIDSPTVSMTPVVPVTITTAPSATPTVRRTPAA